MKSQNIIGNKRQETIKQTPSFIIILLTLLHFYRTR